MQFLHIYLIKFWVTNSWKYMISHYLVSDYSPYSLSFLFLGLLFCLLAWNALLLLLYAQRR